MCLQQHQQWTVGYPFLCIETIYRKLKPATGKHSFPQHYRVHLTTQQNIETLSGRRIFINECAPYDSASAKSFGIMDIAEMVW